MDKKQQLPDNSPTHIPEETPVYPPTYSHTYTVNYRQKTQSTEEIAADSAQT